MADPATRVALLARPGDACERLSAALRAAGAELVLVADPTVTDAASLQAVQAQAVLVALEPSVEDALQRFDAVLTDPAITVIFDEAELAAQRDGWDAARWVRHLAAKLNRHDDVLPPSAESDPDPDMARDLQPGRPSLYQRPDGDHDIGNVTDEAASLAATVPQDFGDADSAGQGTLRPVPPVAIEPDDSVTTDRFRRDLDDLQLRIANMELEGAERGPAPVTQSQGAVLVLAGVGGPDAVRQLLAALPEQFPRPILIQQRLDGARHDKLVRQVQRATAMPVHLAEAGDALQAGHVYVLPSGIGVVAGGQGLRLGEDDGAVMRNLPPADSAIMMLSGSDPAMVDAAMGHAWSGALVAGQSPDGCFDAVAAEALIARGAQTGSPMELARQLAARWPA
ncbi:MAG: chemotaxis protein [Gammaproteobacteria bacterium]|nr:chemotaxis protein [Gammaproteobacteria bacterium]